MNALFYKLAITHAVKFTLYETVFQNFNKQSDNQVFASIGAAAFTALLTTTLTYPLDLAHGRMAADMSKKPSAVIA